jgi:hypothetical protein
VWIGRWINEGHTIDERGNPGMRIITSDIYEWAPGGFFVLHTAHGRIGEFGGGAVTRRATVVFGDGDTVQTVLHERSDGSTFVPSMRVTLVKVA